MTELLRVIDVIRNQCNAFTLCSGDDELIRASSSSSQGGRRKLSETSRIVAPNAQQETLQQQPQQQQQKSTEEERRSQKPENNSSSGKFHEDWLAPQPRWPLSLGATAAGISRRLISAMRRAEASMASRNPGGNPGGKPGEGGPPLHHHHHAPSPHSVKNPVNPTSVSDRLHANVHICNHARCAANNPNYNVKAITPPKRFLVAKKHSFGGLDEKQKSSSTSSDHDNHRSHALHPLSYNNNSTLPPRNGNGAGNAAKSNGPSSKASRRNAEDRGLHALANSVLQHSRAWDNNNKVAAERRGRPNSSSSSSAARVVVQTTGSSGSGRSNNNGGAIRRSISSTTSSGVTDLHPDSSSQNTLQRSNIQNNRRRLEEKFSYLTKASSLPTPVAAANAGDQSRDQSSNQWEESASPKSSITSISITQIISTTRGEEEIEGEGEGEEEEEQIRVGVAPSSPTASVGSNHGVEFSPLGKADNDHCDGDILENGRILEQLLESTIPDYFGTPGSETFSSNLQQTSVKEEEEEGEGEEGEEAEGVTNTENSPAASVASSSKPTIERSSPTPSTTTTNGDPSRPSSTATPERSSSLSTPVSEFSSSSLLLQKSSLVEETMMSNNDSSSPTTTTTPSIASSRAGTASEQPQASSTISNSSSGPSPSSPSPTPPAAGRSGLTTCPSSVSTTKLGSSRKVMTNLNENPPRGGGGSSSSAVVSAKKPSRIAKSTSLPAPLVDSSPAAASRLAKKFITDLHANNSPARRGGRTKGVRSIELRGGKAQSFSTTTVTSWNMTTTTVETSVSVSDDSPEKNGDSGVLLPRSVSAVASVKPPWQSNTKRIAAADALPEKEGPTALKFATKARSTTVFDEVHAESETVSLKHGEVAERRLSEEWMTNHALEGVVKQIADKDHRVKVLVHAFETLATLSDSESPANEENTGLNTQLEYEVLSATPIAA